MKTKANNISSSDLTSRTEFDYSIILMHNAYTHIQTAFPIRLKQHL